jgi:hypothetical protein
MGLLRNFCEMEEVLGSIFWALDSDMKVLRAKAYSNHTHDGDEHPSYSAMTLTSHV